MSSLDSIWATVLEESYELPNNVLRAMPVPLVSVWTITYNQGPYIAQCIESVLAQQTTFDVEYIIAEDCSTDETRSIVFDYAARYPNQIRVITADRNVGSKGNSYRARLACRGRYIALCEGDDYWTDTRKLEKQIQMLEANLDCVMVVHRARRVDQAGRCIKVFPNAQAGIVSARAVILRGGGWCATNSLVFRKSLGENLPAWYYLFPAGDAAMLNLAILRGNVFLLPDIMSVYRNRTSGSYSERLIRDPRVAFDVCRRTRSALWRVIGCERAFIHYYLCRIALLYWATLRVALAAHVKRPVLRMLTRMTGRYQSYKEKDPRRF